MKKENRKLYCKRQKFNYKCFRGDPLVEMKFSLGYLLDIDNSNNLLL